MPHYFTIARHRAKERAFYKMYPALKGRAGPSIRYRSFVAMHPKAYGTKFHRRAMMG